MVGADVSSAVNIADNTMCILGDSKMVIDASSKEIGGVSYTARLKMGGSVSLDSEGYPKSKAMIILPGVEGTLKIAFAHASSSGADRELIVKQGTEAIGSYTIAPSNNTAYTVDVTAGEVVYIYSPQGLNFYGVHFTAGEAAEETEAPADPTDEPTDATDAPADVTAEPTDATDAPATTAPTTAPTVAPATTAPTTAPTAAPAGSAPAGLEAVYEDTDWLMSDYSYVDVTSDVMIGEDTLYIYGDSKMTIDSSNKTIGEIKYTSRLKFGGGVVLGSDGTPKGRAIGILPGVNGTVKVALHTHHQAVMTELFWQFRMVRKQHVQLRQEIQGFLK